MLALNKALLTFPQHQSFLLRLHLTAVIAGKELLPGGKIVARKGGDETLTEDQIRGVLQGWLQAHPTIAIKVVESAHRAFGVVRGEVDDMVGQMNKVRAELVDALASLQNAKTTAVKAGTIQWRSRAAVAYRSALELHQKQLEGIETEHQELLGQLDVAAAQLQSFRAELSLDHPAVVSLTHRSIGALSFVAAEIDQTMRTVTTPMWANRW